MDELESAFKNRDVSQQQFDLALSTSDKLKNGLLSDKATFETYIQKMYDLIKQS